MNKGQGDKSITVAPARVLLIVFLLVVVMPVLVGFVFMPGLTHYWVERFYGPGLERDLGFRASRQVILLQGAQVDVFALTWVDPQGCLGRAGVKAGDIPRLYHGAGDFWDPLRRVRDGETIDLDILPAELWGKGGRAHRQVRVGPCSQPAAPIAPR